MLQSIPTAPPDAILGLTEAFRHDPNPDKINLTVGVYKDASGVTPVLDCVKSAERRLLDEETSKSYLAIDGNEQYDRLVQQLLLGEQHEILQSQRMATLQTPGGTGALRVAADFIKTQLPKARIWCSNPTWPNHPTVFTAAGLNVETYPYFEPSSNSLDFDSMISAIRRIPSGDVVVLHACCHNPTGVDPTAQQWHELSEAIHEKGLLPLIDFAYQGFGRGLEDDASSLRAFCRPDCELIVCNSFSKNFGLYNERVGALSIVATNNDATTAVLSQLKACVRANYSNPPAHGAAVVAVVLSEPSLRADWEGELQQMRDRINGMRKLFAERMNAKSLGNDYSFIRKQLGMFSFTGLSGDQVDQLREKYSIYIVRSGRINVAGITEANVDRLCDAVATVL